MMHLELSIEEFFKFITCLGLGSLILIYLIHMLLQLQRSYRRRQSHLRCRICGFQFICKQKVAICPHCQARNR